MTIWEAKSSNKQRGGLGGVCPLNSPGRGSPSKTSVAPERAHKRDQGLRHHRGSSENEPLST